MGMTPLKCPSCGADIALDDSKEFGFCQFCGTKIQNDAVKRLKIEYSGNPMAVTNVYNNKTTNTSYYIERQANIIVSKPKISLMVKAIIFLTLGGLFLAVTIGQMNPSGLIITVPFLVIGLVYLFVFIKQYKYYDMAMKNAIHSNDVTNRNG